MANILYAYDGESSSFSALPASPWLLPAIFLLVAIGIIDEAKRAVPVNICAPPGTDPEAYEIKRQRYYELLPKFVDSSMTYPEEMEWQKLIYPPGHKGAPLTY
jgi:hypothetical protein